MHLVRADGPTDKSFVLAEFTYEFRLRTGSDDILVLIVFSLFGARSSILPIQRLSPQTTNGRNYFTVRRARARGHFSVSDRRAHR